MMVGYVILLLRGFATLITILGALSNILLLVDDCNPMGYP